MTETISAAAYRSQTPEKKRSKYGNKKVERHGRTFDSIKEANRYDELLLLEQAGEISHLECQPKLLMFSGTTPIRGDTGRHMFYQGDFAYFCAKRDKRIIEDVKSRATKTRLYKLKKAVLKACYPGIEIVEV